MNKRIVLTIALGVIALFMMHIAVGNQDVYSINSCMNITEPGHYILNSSLTGVQKGKGYCIGIFVSNVLINGTYHSLKGSEEYGIYVDSSNVTVEDLTIESYYYGLYVNGSDNKLHGINATGCTYGIYVKGNNNTIEFINITDDKVGLIINGSYTTVKYITAYNDSQIFSIHGFNNRVRDAVNVTFIEEGLPHGVKWYVELNKALASSTTNTITFIMPPGNYSYKVNPIRGFKLTVNATYINAEGNRTILVTFKGIVNIILLYTNGTKINATLSYTPINLKTSIRRIIEINNYTRLILEYLDIYNVLNNTERIIQNNSINITEPANVSAIYQLQYFIGLILPNGATLRGWYNNDFIISPPSIIRNGSDERFILSKPSLTIIVNSTIAGKAIDLTPYYVKQFYVTIYMPDGIPPLAEWYNDSSVIYLHRVILTKYDMYILLQSGAIRVTGPLTRRPFYVSIYVIVVIFVLMFLATVIIARKGRRAYYDVATV